MALQHKIHRDVVIPLAWQWVSRVRQELAEVMANHREDVRDAVIMAGSELAENVVKYGESVPGQESGHVAIDVNTESVRLTSTNGVRDPGRVARVRAHIDRIGAAMDVQALYVERLQQLIQSPCEDSTGLGLIRVAYEGRFALSCTYRDGVLTVCAERAI